MTGVFTWTSASLWQKSNGKAKVDKPTSFGWIPLAVVNSTCLLGGKYTKNDFKDYEKSMDNRSKLAFKDQVKSQQEYPSVFLAFDVFEAHLKSPPKPGIVVPHIKEVKVSITYLKVPAMTC